MKYIKFCDDCYICPSYIEIEKVTNFAGNCLYIYISCPKCWIYYYTIIEQVKK